MVAVLTESVNPANYWKVLKNRLKKEGNQSVTNCNQLKLRAADGKYYKTDVATAEQMFRVIQSMSIAFFKMVQNKLHYAAHGHTAAEVIYERADADKPFMGLTAFAGEFCYNVGYVKRKEAYNENF